VQVGPNIVEEIGGERGDQDEQLAHHRESWWVHSWQSDKFRTSAASSFLKGAAVSSTVCNENLVGALHPKNKIMKEDRYSHLN